MESKRSGGGYETPEQESTTNKRSPAEDLTLEELFSEADHVGHDSTAAIQEADLEGSIDALDQLEYPKTDPDHGAARALKIWTVATLLLAFAVSAGLGTVSYTTGSQLAAFVSGGLVGLGTATFGFLKITGAFVPLT